MKVAAIPTILPKHQSQQYSHSAFGLVLLQPKPACVAAGAIDASLLPRIVGDLAADI